jgi:hypothetical protein
MTLTISWQPGALKGMTKQQTDAVIIGGCQMWQKVCGIRFAVLPFGYPTTFTIYPWNRPMNGVMVAYPATRQILYSTLVALTPQWARMAIAHELAHCVGWGHSPTSRVEDLMHPRGSSVFYFSANEARRTRQQFGNPPRRVVPESITFVKSEIARIKKIKPQTTTTAKQIKDREAQLTRLQREWQSIGDPKWVKAPAPATDICECFASDNKVGSVETDWESVFRKLRAGELKAGGAE